MTLRTRTRAGKKPLSTGVKILQQVYQKRVTLALHLHKKLSVTRRLWTYLGAFTYSNERVWLELGDLVR